MEEACERFLEPGQMCRTRGTKEVQEEWADFHVVCTDQESGCEASQQTGTLLSLTKILVGDVRALLSVVAVFVFV